MRRKTAKEILSDSFRELAAAKNIDKITIKDITENCGYSQATFYRQFRDKYDLIAWGYSRDMERILAQFDGTRESWEKALADAAEYYDTQREYLANLLLHTTGYDSFVRYMTEINFGSLQHYAALAAPDRPDEKTKMYMRLYCLGTVSFTCEWILGKYSADRNVLTEIYAGSMPKPLMDYLSLT